MRHLQRMRCHAIQYLLPLLLLLAGPVSAQDRVWISELSELDRRYMNQQRTDIDDIARRQLGQGFSGQKDRDLDLLQRMLDRELVRPDQTREQQAMGLILGDLLAQELGMHWVVYEDQQGRSRALRYRETDNYLFPMTMISRRQEVANQASVHDIYQQAVEAITRYREPLPFQ